MMYFHLVVVLGSNNVTVTIGSNPMGIIGITHACGCFIVYIICERSISSVFLGMFIT